ncbi:hypothetical protein ACIBEJ_33260 [Nonomuraea sp. NPDC050790]|uniref:hypothetical protein n=1 Tax=Nonomuraea sp. NPDC050790 TaxID=3364371 RepID=UPI0037946F61
MTSGIGCQQAIRARAPFSSAVHIAPSGPAALTTGVLDCRDLFRPARQPGGRVVDVARLRLFTAASRAYLAEIELWGPPADEADTHPRSNNGGSGQGSSSRAVRGRGRHGWSDA